LAAGAPNTGYYDWPVTGPVSSGTCYLRADARDYAGNVNSATSSAGFTIASGALAVGGSGPGPTFALEPIAPNPSTSHARVTYVVPRPARVRISVVDLQGRELAVLAEGDREVGQYTISLDARGLRPGVNFVRMQAAGESRIRRVVVLR
jgi:hypothetical protein